MMSKAKVKLLIVDDEVSIRMSLAQIFLACGYSVRSDPLDVRTRLVSRAE